MKILALKLNTTRAMALFAEDHPHKEDCSISLNDSENSSAKRLPNVLVAILVEEYIQTAKENPEIFSNKGVFMRVEIYV